MKIFLSGAISNIPSHDATYWRELFEEETSFSHTVINPTSLYKPSNTSSLSYEAEAMFYDLHHVRDSDVIIVNFNTLYSIGTAQELMLAHILHKPIIGMIPESKYKYLHPWFKLETIKLFIYEDSESNLRETIKSVLEYIERFN